MDKLNPRFVKLPRPVRGDGPFRATVAPAGVYVAHLNPHGAVSVRATNGELLGVKPSEFDWVESREPTKLYVVVGGQNDEEDDVVGVYSDLGGAAHVMSLVEHSRIEERELDKLPDAPETRMRAENDIPNSEPVPPPDGIAMVCDADDFLPARELSDEARRRIIKRITKGGQCPKCGARPPVWDSPYCGACPTPAGQGAEG